MSLRLALVLAVTGCLAERTDTNAAQPIDVHNSVARCDVTTGYASATGDRIVQLDLFPLGPQEHQSCRDRDGHSIRCPDVDVGLVDDLGELADEFIGEGSLDEHGAGTVATFEYTSGDEGLEIRGDQDGALTLDGTEGSFVVEHRHGVTSGETIEFENCVWGPLRDDLQYEYVLTMDVRRPGEATPIKRQHTEFVVTLFPNQLVGVRYACSMTVGDRAYEAVLTQREPGGPFVYQMGSRDLATGAVFRDETEAGELRDLDHDTRINDTTHRAKLVVQSVSKWRERTPPEERGFFPDAAFFLSKVPAAPQTRGELTCKTL